MPAPRMRVAVFGDSAAGRALAEAMARAGHSVEPLRELECARDYDALVLAVGETRLPAAVAQLAPHVADNQICIHTCLSKGVQVMDELEIAGAVVIAAAPVSSTRWAVTALDELGETIAALIVSEIGAVAVAKTDAERGPLAARVEYARMLSRLADAAAADVQRHMDSETQVEQMAPDLDAAVAGLGHIEDPGLRRAYLEAARRVGEVDEVDELEMWAMQEESR